MAGISPDDVRELALALPEAVEQDHHGFPSFRVRKKIFATWPDEGHLHIMLSEDGIREALAVYADACAEQYWGKRLAALRVDLARIEQAPLVELLEEAWRRRAPKSLQARLPDSG